MRTIFVRQPGRQNFIPPIPQALRAALVFHRVSHMAGDADCERSGWELLDLCGAGESALKKLGPPGCARYPVLTLAKSFRYHCKVSRVSSSAPVLPPYFDAGRPGVGPEVPNSQGKHRQLEHGLVRSPRN